MRVLALVLAAAAVLAGTAWSGGRAVPAKDRCTFASGATAAFCDTFDRRQAGGRSGDLDPARWSVANIDLLVDPGR